MKNESENYIFGMEAHIVKHHFDTFLLNIEDLTDTQKIIRYASDYVGAIESIFSRDCVEYENAIKSKGGHEEYFKNYFSNDFSKIPLIIEALKALDAKEYVAIFTEISNKFISVYNNLNNCIEETIKTLKNEFKIYDKKIRDLDHKFDAYLNNFNSKELENDLKIYLKECYK